MGEEISSGISKKTYIVYYDETGDDGNNTKSSDTFLLTAVYMPISKWTDTYLKIKEFRKKLKDDYGLHISEEIHTKHLLCDKDPYRKYMWSAGQKQSLVKDIIVFISNLEIQVINVMIDKTRISRQDYKVLENALTYSIQRIENDSKNDWNYIIITDEGRIEPMRKTARAIRVYNPIHSKYSRDYANKPIKNLVEDILQKNSNDSWFIQISDFISYFTHLYRKCCVGREELPKRVQTCIDKTFIGRAMATFKKGGILNLNATKDNAYGIVIYPK